MFKPAGERQAWPTQAVLPCPTALPERSAAMQAQCAAARGFQAPEGPQSRDEPSGHHADSVFGQCARFALVLMTCRGQLRAVQHL